jgi:hypothetical protein
MTVAYAVQARLGLASLRTRGRLRRGLTVASKNR